MQRATLTILYRVKLPKSFLAVNLSESHSFHKKEDVDVVEGQVLGEAVVGDVPGVNGDQREEQKEEQAFEGSE